MPLLVPVLVIPLIMPTVMPPLMSGKVITQPNQANVVPIEFEGDFIQAMAQAAKVAEADVFVGGIYAGSMVVTSTIIFQSQETADFFLSYLQCCVAEVFASSIFEPYGTAELVTGSVASDTYGPTDVEDGKDDDNDALWDEGWFWAALAVAAMLITGAVLLAQWYVQARHLLHSRRQEQVQQQLEQQTYIQNKEEALALPSSGQPVAPTLMPRPSSASNRVQPLDQGLYGQMDVASAGSASYS